MVSMEDCLIRLEQFIQAEFARMDSEKMSKEPSFTFTMSHALRGTTAVWGRSNKTIIPRGFSMSYAMMMNRLVKGTLRIGDYSFESFPGSHRTVYRVTRCINSTQSE
jgi:hypothetical protein